MRLEEKPGARASDEEQRAEVLEAFAARYCAWPHQAEALRRALAGNVILNLPTGTGKTLVACMLLDALYRQGALNLFIVSSVALVAQQAQYVREHTLLSLSVSELSGEGCTGGLLADVLVGTAEVFRRALEAGHLLAHQVNVLVVDEAHYAVGRHPYAETLSLLWAQGGAPRVLGLTASFLHGAFANAEKKRESLVQLFQGTLISPEVQGPQTEHSFFNVPWARGAAVAVEDIAVLEERSAAAVAALRAHYQCWELHAALEKELGRVRGVVEGLGYLGWHHFMCRGLVDLVRAKLVGKLQYTEEQTVKEGVKTALSFLPCVHLELADAIGEPAERNTTGKCDVLVSLLARLLKGSQDKAIVFVERVSFAGPMAAILAERLGVEVCHACGVQAMDDAARRLSLSRFRGEAVQVLVATNTLEEGLDVPACRYVVRYDHFASAKSHVQGSGRARHPQAQVYYFANEPVAEEARRQAVDAVARGGSCSEAASAASGAGAVPGVGGSSVDPAPGSPTRFVAGQGAGHRWGEEETMWDFGANHSFRGAACACGTRLHITSRAYGKGRKKKERSFEVEGPEVCPRFTEPPDPRFCAPSATDLPGGS